MLRRTQKWVERTRVSSVEDSHLGSTPDALSLAVEQVVSADLCSGCGACCRLDGGLQMALDDEGFSRPVRVGPIEADPTAAARSFARLCPGVTLRRPREAGQREHPVLGRYVEAWSGWALDDAFRERGSSGGVLSALTAYLTEQGLAVAAAARSPLEARRTVPVTITSREEALASAGSRYAPVGTASNTDPVAAFVGKPCEASAVRVLASEECRARPLLLSFFCAGSPSQLATESLLGDLGLSAEDDVVDLWYRGNGWPGRFTVALESEQRSLSYEESWGGRLGRQLQWRCKVCPDGVGEFADVVAADFWEADDRGYPQFKPQAGRSALIARTERGAVLLREARAAGAVMLEPMDLDALARVQPLQVSRRSTLAGRLWGMRLARRPTPRFRDFGLGRLALLNLAVNARAARGTYSRMRRANFLAKRSPTRRDA